MISIDTGEINSFQDMNQYEAVSVAIYSPTWNFIIKLIICNNLSSSDLQVLPGTNKSTVKKIVNVAGKMWFIWWHWVE